MNLSTDYTSPSSTRRATQNIFFFLFFNRQNISFAPKMRSAETQKTSKSCHGLLVQLNWKHIRASEPFQGSGKCFASPLCSSSPASGIHKFYPDGEKNCYSLYNLCFCERQFSYFWLGVSEAWIIRGSRFSSYPCLQGRYCDKNKVSVQYRWKQAIPTLKHQK